MTNSKLLTEQSPAEIDAQLFIELQAAWAAWDKQEQLVERLHSLVGDKKRYGERGVGVWQMRKADVLAAAESSDQARVWDVLAQYRQQGTLAIDAHRRAEPLNAEYTRRGGWTRAYLVDNADGHVHRSERCSTFRLGTRYHWLTELSGHSETEIVELAGERACTVCYPSAPIDVLKRPSKLEGPAQHAAREAAAAKVVEKAAKKVAQEAAQVVDPETGEQLFKTERGALNEVSSTLQSMHWYGATHPSYRSWETEARRIVGAVAAKRSDDAEVLYAELDAKAAKKVAKDRRG
jgi:hypothetical protein